jgi:hypothetical protein
MVRVSGDVPLAHSCSCRSPELPRGDPRHQEGGFRAPVGTDTLVQGDPNYSQVKYYLSYISKEKKKASLNHFPPKTKPNPVII